MERGGFAGLYTRAQHEAGLDDQKRVYEDRLNASRSEKALFAATLGFIAGFVCGVIAFCWALTLLT